MQTASTTQADLVSHSPWIWRPTILGSICGAMAAVGYTVVNCCLREVANCDPIWVSCIKALPTAVVCAIPLLVGALRGQSVLPPRRVLVALALAGLLGQVGGNVVFQWALGVIGLGLSVPLCMGTIILASAVLARVFLHESVTPRAVFCMAILTTAIWILSLGAGDAYRSVANEVPSGRVLIAGVAAACLSGLAYSVLGVVIRYGVTGQASIAATTFTVGLLGVLVLGSMSYARMGLAGLEQTTQHEWIVMLAAGVLNLLAFLALAKALQLVPLVYVNAINASQVAMAAVAGVVLFHESLSIALCMGVAMTALGLLLMPRHEPGAN